MTRDPDEILARMRADQHSDWPDRLLADIREAPLVDKPNNGKSGFRGARMRAGDIPVDLTAMEARTLQALAGGMTHRMLADLYGMGEEAVKQHSRSARYKLRAKNTTHACCEALRLRLIE